jgi:hypothetical protein
MEKTVTKIKDLPPDTNLQNVAVKLPEELYYASSLPLSKVDNVPVYLMGWTMGDFFVKINREDTRIYPMFWISVPEDIEEWEVVDDFNVKTQMKSQSE